MTDAQTKLKLQHAHATNTLNYGHLGTASYVEHSKDWAFLRGQNEEITDHATVAGQHVIRPAFPFACIANETRHIQQLTAIGAADVETHNSALTDRSLSRLLPELLSETGNHLQRSTTTSEEHNSGIESLLQQNQLAFGGAAAVLDNGKSHRTVPIAAVVTGKNFEEVKIMLIEKEVIQLNDANGHGRGYQIPKIDYSEEDCWVGNGDTVQQVCFAAACDYETTQSAWLAARCRSGTTIFHPLFHKTRYQRDGNTSRLDIKPILGIPVSHTGGQAHADVSFHPQDNKMLAIVDEHGNWSIWKIEGRHTIVGRVLFVAHLQSAGRLFPERSSVSTEGTWHKICWISRSPHETDRLLVSNRSHAAIFDLTGSNLGVLDLRGGSAKEGQMILDVVKSATNPTHCYILTSTKVLLMSAGEDDWTDPKGHQQMAMILSWSHYRDRSDSSLRLILVEAAQATTILITSTHNTMITAMRVGLNMEQSSLPVSLVDPTHLSTFNRDTGTSQLGLRVLAFRKLQVQYGTSMEPNGDDIVLFKAFMGRRDMPLDEVLYRCTDDGIFSAFGQPQSTAIPLPVWRPFRKPPWSNKYANAENLDDFVATNELKLWALEKPLAHPHVGSLSTINQSINAKSITINWEDIYSVAAGRDNDVTEDKPPVELAEALEEVQVGITEGADPPALLQTLREMIGRPILMGDFESGSQSLEQFARGLSRTRNSQSRLAQLPRLNALAESRSVEDLFHRLSERWVATLPLSTDNRIRLSKDRLARSVAADLALASMAIGPCMETTFAMDTTEPQRRQHESIHPDIDELPSSPPSLAGEPPVRRELGFQASVPAPAPAPTEDPACARLRKYGVLSKPIIPLSTSTVLTDMLAHLPTDINVDPSSYSWRETEARLATSHAEEAAEKLHPRQEAARRKKVKKLAAAQKRRLEAQRQISQAAELDFAPPTITMSSQFPAQREVQSSQTRLVEDEDVIPVVMTQPVTGTFGSRIGPAGKAQGFKKKARQQGF